MIQWLIYYLFFLVIFLILTAIYIVKTKVLRPFRVMLFILFIIALPFLMQFILYSLSPQLPTVRVPSLLGLTTEQAQKITTSNKLSLKIKEVIPPENTPAGIILEQTPPADSTVKTGKTIFVAVSSGPQKLAAPNLIGRPLSQIYVVLQEMGLVLGNIEVKANQEYPNNTVIEQIPAPGEAVEPKTSIDITISINPNEVE